PVGSGSVPLWPRRGLFRDCLVAAPSFPPRGKTEIAKPHFRGRNQERCVNYFTLAALVSLIVTLLLHPPRRGKRIVAIDRHIVEIRRRLDNTAESLAPMIALRNASSP